MSDAPPSTPLASAVRHGMHLAETDIANIWLALCQFIAHNLSKGKGVALLNIGTFTISNQTPIFTLTEAFLLQNDVRTSQLKPPTTAPIVGINFAHIALMSGYERAVVEFAIKDVFAALVRQLRDGDNIAGISLMFFGIGKLTVRNGKVRFKFFQEFLEEQKPACMETLSKLTFSSRPATVGNFGPEDASLRPATSCSRPLSRSQLATPRLVCTPRVSSLGLGLGPVPDSGAWNEDDSGASAGAGAQAKSAKESKMAPIKWEYNPAVNRTVAIVDGAAEKCQHEVVDAFAALEAKARRPVVRPRTADPSILSPDEAEAFKVLAERNMHSTLDLHVPLPPDENATAKSAAQAQAASGPTAKAVDKARPQTADPVLDYASWLKTQEGGQLQGRHWRNVRDTGDLDPSIQEQEQAALRQLDQRLDSLHKVQSSHADALESLLAQTRAEARKRAAVFNVTAADERHLQEMKAAAAAKAEKPASHVFVNRPPTSKSAIRRNKEDYSRYLRKQAEDYHSHEEHRQRQELEADRSNNEELAERLRQEQQMAEQQEHEEMRRYKSELDALQAFRKEREQQYAQVHPRQPVPFDVKHLPATDATYRPTNSALGRPAAALGPELFFAQDRREELRRLINKQACEAQMQFQVARDRVQQDQVQKEKAADRAIAVKNAALYAEELREIANVHRQDRRGLEVRWKSAQAHKAEARQDEVQHRKLPCEKPMREQLDYSAYINGYV